MGTQQGRSLVYSRGRITAHGILSSLNSHGSGRSQRSVQRRHGAFPEYQLRAMVIQMVNWRFSRRTWWCRDCSHFPVLRTWINDFSLTCTSEWLVLLIWLELPISPQYVHFKNDFGEVTSCKLQTRSTYRKWGLGFWKSTSRHFSRLLPASVTYPHFKSDWRVPWCSRGILLCWALWLISEEIDKEADTLLHADGSPFCCPEKWTWESLSQLSPDSQQAFAKERAPFLWSILTTIAINKDRRESMELKDEGRDPWQVCGVRFGIDCSQNISRELLQLFLPCSIYETRLLPSFPEFLDFSSSHVVPTASSTSSYPVLVSLWHTLPSTNSFTSVSGTV